LAVDKFQVVFNQGRAVTSDDISLRRKKVAICEIVMRKSHPHIEQHVAGDACLDFASDGLAEMEGDCRLQINPRIPCHSGKQTVFDDEPRIKGLELHNSVQMRGQKFSQRASQIRKLVCALRHFSAIEFDNLRNQLFLRVEVKEYRSVGNACCLGNVRHASVYNAARGKHLVCRFKGAVLVCSFFRFG